MIVLYNLFLSFSFKSERIFGCVLNIEHTVLFESLNLPF